MPARSSRMHRHMADLKMLADLLADIADRLPRRAGDAGTPDREMLATLSVALPELTATCNVLFETLTQEAALANDPPSVAHGPVADEC